jgi:hypothetical protein
MFNTSVISSDIVVPEDGSDGQKHVGKWNKLVYPIFILGAV